MKNLRRLARYAAVGVAALGIAAASAHATPPSEAQLEANKRMVIDMWHGVIERADDAAAMRYIAPDYIQHNPNVMQGRAGLLAMMKLIRNPPPGFVAPGHKTLLRAIAQDDFVVLIWDQPQPDPAAPGQTYTGKAFDMFRIKDGMIAEHWDDTRKAAKPWQ